MRKKVLLVGGLLLLTVLMGACGKDLPQNTFDPAGPTAQSEKDVLMLPLAIAGVIFVLVEGGILLIAIKYRHRKGRERMPKQLHGNTRLELGWTIAPAFLLAIVVVPAISLIWRLSEIPPGAMQIKVQGYQWWWGFQYLDEDMQVDYGDKGPITTADVLVIPTNTTINLSLESDRWSDRRRQPRPHGDPLVLGAAPVRQARRRPRGLGRGQPHRVLRVGAGHLLRPVRGVLRPAARHDEVPDRRAGPRATGRRGLPNHKQPAQTPTAGSLAAQGMDLFLGTNGEGGQCIACHAIGGTPAGSPAGPNLTNFADPTHECFAGCDFETFNPDGTPNQEALAAWLRDPNAVKMGTKMPNYHLSEEEIDALVAYLYTLS